MNKKLKNCPFCGEEILAIAKKCKHCGEMLENTQGASLHGNLEVPQNNINTHGKSSERKSKHLPAWVSLAVVGGALFLVVLTFMSVEGKKADKTTYNFAHSKKAPKLSAEEKQRRADNAILKTIWIAYHNIPGNAADDRNEKGRIIKRGTVPSSAMNTTVEGRLQAYLACYDYINVFSMAGMTGDSKADMCIYYINNPTMGRSAMQWRGKKYIEQLEGFMRDDGFMEKYPTR